MRRPIDAYGGHLGMNPAANAATCDGLNLQLVQSCFCLVCYGMYRRASTTTIKRSVSAQLCASLRTAHSGVAHLGMC